jgi:hypothetical protein
MVEQLAPCLIEQNQNFSTTRSSSTAFSQALGTSDTLFDYISKHPEHEIEFAHCMRGVSESMKSWVDIYPTESLLVDNDDGLCDGVVVVDIGGSTGHDINAFQRKHRLKSGRLVLQDLEKVLEQAEVEPNITIMPHDFFRAQTVKGKARPQAGIVLGSGCHLNSVLTFHSSCFLPTLHPSRLAGQRGL